MAVEVSFCIVNTEQRELLLRCLDAVAAERAALPFETEALVLDNASRDGSAGAARMHVATDELIRLDHRRGKGENRTALLQRARGRFAVLLDHGTELRPGATAVLHAAVAAREDAAIAGPMLLDADGRHQASAWRFPGPRTALMTALWLHPRFVVQSRGDAVRTVDWCESSAMLMRRSAAEEVGWFDPAFFVFSDEVDLCRRLRDRGRRVLYVPEARAVVHENAPTGEDAIPRIVELARNRDRYMRKHHGPGAARAVRWLTAWSYATRTAGGVVAPGHDPRRYARHVRATLRPDRGEGLAEQAADFNRGTRL